MKRFLRSKILWSVVVVLIMIRLVLPFVLVREANKFLAEFSPTVSGHIESVGLSIWRGAYHFHTVELRLKSNAEERFFFAKEIDVSGAWRELFRGRITTEIIVTDLSAVWTRAVAQAFQSDRGQAEADSKNAAAKLFPTRVERLDIVRGRFEFAEVLDIPEAERWRVTGIEGRASNLTPTPESPLMFVVLRGALFETANLQVAAHVLPEKERTAWDVDLELRNFDLRSANTWLKRKVPLTFTSGHLDLFAEVRSQGDGFEGYVKPFLKRADIVASNESFLNLKHYGVEIATAALNLILREAREKTLATKVMFLKQGNAPIKINSLEALNSAFRNGFNEPVPTGIDDELSLSETDIKKGVR